MTDPLNQLSLEFPLASAGLPSKPMGNMCSPAADYNGAHNASCQPAPLIQLSLPRTLAATASRWTLMNDSCFGAASAPSMVWRAAVSRDYSTTPARVSRFLV